MKTPLKCNARLTQDGMAMPLALLLSMLVVSLGAAAVLQVGREVQAGGHYKRGKQAMAAAESGALHAFGSINRKLVKNFDQEIVQKWNIDPSLLGSATTALATASSSNYQVEVMADPNDPSASGFIIARGKTLNERNGVSIRVRRRFSFEWGALYVANDTASGSFNGNSFDIDGRNYRTFANAPAGDGLEVPGIGTAGESAAAQLRAGVASQQSDNIIGAGDEPSIYCSGGPTSTQLTEIGDAILDLGVHTTYAANGGGVLSGNRTMGTLGNPEVSYVTGARTINGSVEGVGILLVDGDVDLKGNFTWTGWVIVRGSVTMSGSSSVQGSLWTSGIETKGGGNASVHFCIECLQLANSKMHLDQLPSKVEVIGWEELPWDEL